MFVCVCVKASKNILLRKILYLLVISRKEKI